MHAHTSQQVRASIASSVHWWPRGGTGYSMRWRPPDRPRTGQSNDSSSWSAVSTAE